LSETPRRTADPWNETAITVAEEAGIRELARLSHLASACSTSAAVPAL
jgi:hypothetical protein